MLTASRAFWFDSPGVGSIHEEALADAPDGWCRIETEACGISPGTERLVGLGRVPAESWTSMRCQYMAGDFGFPMKYGYSLVGHCVEGPPSLIGRRVHTMHPHQDRCNVEAHAAFPIPTGIPPLRATLASNLETAVNAIWDAEVKIGSSAAVFGFGIVGSLVARLFSLIPGAELLIVDMLDEKRTMAGQMGFQAAATADAGAFDVAFECSGSPEGLQAALDAVGRDGRVVAVSWYGDRNVALRLGTDFHYGRKRIVSSQVSNLPAEMLSRWDFRRRKELVFRLLQSPVLDLHITQVVGFEDLPTFFQNLCTGGYRGLSAAVEFGRPKEA
jgi:threonine dehydrogenase-like Zn-dependent dehydrogenase